MARVAFLQHIWYEVLGPMCLSACLKEKGHRCEMFIGSADKIIKEAFAYEPDIICFSALTAQFPWALDAARRVKKAKPSLPVVFGGIHATFFPEVIEEGAIDAVCVGEGEEAIVEIADRIDAKRDFAGIANLHVKHGEVVLRNAVRELTRDLDSLPPPDRSLYYRYKFIADNPEKPFMSGRGCPYHCTFCFNHLYMKLYAGKGPIVRQRKIENVINEIKAVKSRYLLKLVFFQDDTFVLSKKWVYEFLPRYKKEIGVPFIAYVRAPLVDEELVRRLKDHGCSVVAMGVETGNEQRRNIQLKKNVTDSQLKDAARIMHKYGLRFKTSNMLGLPGETFENALETLRLNIELKPTMTWCSLFQPYPKLELTEFAINRGYMSKEDISRIGGSFDKSILRMRDIKKIKNLHRFFIFTVRFPCFVPIVKVLSALPNNKLFDAFGVFSHAFMYFRYTRTSFLRLLRETFKMIIEGSYKHVT